MIFEELNIALELCFDTQDKITFLKKTCEKCYFGYFFIDDDNGKCYLFDENGNEDNIRKIKVLEENYIRKDVKKIIVPNSVTNIGRWAFEDCLNLTSINIPDSVTSIGNWAFCDCINLTNINIPDSVINIGNSAFGNCQSLTNINIPNSVKTINGWAFRNCKSLTNINIPDSVKTIGYKAFYNCLNLKNVTFKGKTLEQVKAMEDYPWGIEDKSIMQCC